MSTTRERHTKKARLADASRDDRIWMLQNLRAKCKCTLSGLLEVLQTLKISVKAHELQFANQIHFEAVCLKEQIRLADASFFNWEFADPYLLVQRALQDCPSLRAAYARAAAANPGP